MAESGRRPSSIDRALVAISQTHKNEGFLSPTADRAVRETLKGIKRSAGIAPQQKLPIAVEHLFMMVKLLPDNVIGLRDRALLLLGFAGGFRRSELVGLDVSDIATVPEGLVVVVRRSKTDQLGEGRKVGIPFGQADATCPVRALRAWLDGAAISEGPVFRSVSRHGRVRDARLTDRSVARIVKRAAKAVGDDPKKFSGHSLRAGLATAAAAAGKSERSIMATTGHRSLVMVRKYIREGSLFRENAADGLL